MNIQLSWDLFVLVFFVIIVSYSFIIGRDNTLKVILGTYISALTADAAGNFFGGAFQGSPLFLRMLESATINSEQEAIIFMKVLIFVGLVILFAVRGAFEVHTIQDKSPVIRAVMCFLYAIMSAGLIVNIILVFVSGSSFVAGVADFASLSASSASTQSAQGLAVLSQLAKQSELLAMILQNTNLWFMGPALIFLFHSLYNNNSN